MPAIKTFTLAARQQEVLGSRLRDIVDEVGDVDIIQISSRVQDAQEPGIRPAQFNAKLHTVAVGDI